VLAVVVVVVATGLVGATVTDARDAPSPRSADAPPRDAAGPGVVGAPVGLADSAVDPAVRGDDGSDRADGDRAETGPDTVRVGVIGSAFGAADAAALDGRIAARHRVAADGRLDPPAVGRPAGDHDAAVARVVAERTDDASLYLATVGAEPTPGQYERAIRWLVANDVDVIVDAGSYYPRTADGAARIAAAADAADAGAVVVTSGGNTARRHWRGGADGPGWLAFDGNGTEGNRLGEGPISGRVTLRLYWTGAADYDLYLYRDTPGADDPVVARSARDAGTAEAIDASLPGGDYYVAVYARDPGDGDAPVDLFAARHRLAHTAPGGGAHATPATPGVVSVGAVDADGAVADYSPTDTDVRAAGTVRLDDGTTLSGTSAAAPVVAGVAVEMTAAVDDGDLPPAAVERLLRATADDAGVNRDAAVAAAAYHDRLRSVGDRNATDEEGDDDDADPRRRSPRARANVQVR